MTPQGVISQIQMLQFNTAITIERDTLYFPCRHHILEIILRSIFDVKISSSSGPDVTLFKHS